MRDQILTRNITGEDLTRLLKANEAAIVPPNQQMNPVFWPSVAIGLLCDLITEGVIQYPPIVVK